MAAKLKVKCPHCGQEGQVKAEFLGKKTRCTRGNLDMSLMGRMILGQQTWMLVIVVCLLGMVGKVLGKTLEALQNERRVAEEQFTVECREAERSASEAREQAKAEWQEAMAELKQRRKAAEMTWIQGEKRAAIVAETQALEQRYDQERIVPKATVVAVINQGFTETEKMKRQANSVLARRWQEIETEVEMLVSAPHLPSVLKTLCGGSIDDETVRQSKVLELFRKDYFYYFYLGDVSMLRESFEVCRYEKGVAPTRSAAEFLEEFRLMVEQERATQTSESQEKLEDEAAKRYPLFKSGERVSLTLKTGLRVSRYSQGLIYSIENEPLKRITAQSVVIGKYTVPRSVLREEDLWMFWEDENRKMREEFIQSKKKVVPQGQEETDNSRRLLAFMGERRYVPTTEWRRNPQAPEAWISQSEVLARLEAALRKWQKGDDCQKLLTSKLAQDGVYYDSNLKAWMPEEERQRQRQLTDCEAKYALDNVCFRLENGGMEWLTKAQYLERRWKEIARTFADKYVWFATYDITGNEWMPPEEKTRREPFVAEAKALGASFRERISAIARQREQELTAAKQRLNETRRRVDEEIAANKRPCYHCGGRGFVVRHTGFGMPGTRGRSSVRSQCAVCGGTGIVWGGY